VDVQAEDVVGHEEGAGVGLQDEDLQEGVRGIAVRGH